MYYLAQGTREASESFDTGISNESWWKLENIPRKICKENFSLSRRCHSMLSVLLYHADKDFLSHNVWRTRTRERHAGSLLTYPIKWRLTLLTLQIALIRFESCWYQVSSNHIIYPFPRPAYRLKLNTKFSRNFIISSSEKYFLLGVSAGGINYRELRRTTKFTKHSATWFVRMVN